MPNDKPVSYKIRQAHARELEQAISEVNKAAEIGDARAIVIACQKLTLALHHQLSDKLRDALPQGFEAVVAEVKRVAIVAYVATSKPAPVSHQVKVDLEAAVEAAIEASKKRKGKKGNGGQKK